MLIIAGLIAFGLIYWYLTKNTEPPPSTMTQEELSEEGLTKQEIRRELRAQRQELRSHSHMMNQSSRTANLLSKSVVRGVKKLK